jgi:hypothetical protein
MKEMDKNIVMAAVLAIVISFGLGLGTVSATLPLTSAYTYSNPAFGIKMQYPSNWSKVDLFPNSSSIFGVGFKSPAGNPLGVLFLSGNVDYGKVTLAKIVSARENQLKQTGFFHIT